MRGPKAKTVSTVTPVKTKRSFETVNGRVPMYTLPRRSILDPLLHIPVIRATRDALHLEVVRRKDLLPKDTKALAAFHRFNFGRTLLDTYRPYYGSADAPCFGRFRLENSRLGWTTNGVWCFQLFKHDRDTSIKHVLHLTIRRAGVSYIRLNLGQVGDIGNPSCVLSVVVDDQEFDVNIISLSFRSFDIILGIDSAQPTLELQLILDRQVNPEGAIFALETIELFESIFTVPVVGASLP